MRRLPDRAVVHREDGINHLATVYADAFLGLLRAAEQVDRALDRDLRVAHGIGLRGFEVLLHLGAFAPDGRLGLSELTAQAPLSQSRTSRLVGQLVDAGLVRRETDPQDGRGVVVSLTARGRSLLEKAATTHLDGLHEQLFSHLTVADVTELARLTRLVLGDDWRRPLASAPEG